MQFIFGMARLESLLSLRQMRYFASVVEQKGFTAAADACAVAQPSLSRHVAQLEESLHERLLLRTRTGVEPTELGWKVYHEVRGILERVNGLSAVVREQAPEPQGRVTVAIPATASGVLVAEIIAACTQSCPKVDLHFNEGLSQMTNSILTSGLVDFGVIPNADEVQDVVSEPLLREHLYLLRLAEDGVGYAPTIGLHEFANEPLVLPTREMHLRRCVEHAATQAGLRLNVRYEQRSQSVIAAFVRAGCALSVGNWPSIISSFDTSRVVAQRIVDPDLTRLISLAYPVQRPLSQASQAVYVLVKDVIVKAVAQGRWRGVLIAAQP